MKKRFLCLVAFLLGAIGASAQTALLAEKQVGKRIVPFVFNRRKSGMMDDERGR